MVVDKSIKCPKVSQFYDLLKIENGTYNYKYVLILGIILGTGTSSQKSKLLFEVYDPECDKSLAHEKVMEMLNIMLDLAINYLPNLVTNDTKPPASESAVKLYTDILLNNRSKVYDLLLKIFVGEKHILGDPVTISQFQSNFESDECGILLTPHGLRSFIFANYEILCKYNDVKSEIS